MVEARDGLRLLLEAVEEPLLVDEVRGSTLIATWRRRVGCSAL